MDFACRNHEYVVWPVYCLKLVLTDSIYSYKIGTWHWLFHQVKISRMHSKKNKDVSQKWAIKATLKFTVLYYRKNEPWRLIWKWANERLIVTFCPLLVQNHISFPFHQQSKQLRIFQQLHTSRKDAPMQDRCSQPPSANPSYNFILLVAPLLPSFSTTKSCAFETIKSTHLTTARNSSAPGTAEVAFTKAALGAAGFGGVGLVTLAFGAGGCFLAAGRLRIPLDAAASFSNSSLFCKLWTAAFSFCKLWKAAFSYCKLWTAFSIILTWNSLFKRFTFWSIDRSMTRLRDCGERLSIHIHSIGLCLNKNSVFQSQNTSCSTWGGARTIGKPFGLLPTKNFDFSFIHVSCHVSHNFEHLAKVDHGAFLIIFDRNAEKPHHFHQSFLVSDISGSLGCWTP